MEVCYVSDAPSRCKWFCVPPADHPISRWAKRGFVTKKLAAYLLSELGMNREEIDAVLLIAIRHPSSLAEIEGGRDDQSSLA